MGRGRGVAPGGGQKLGSLMQGDLERKIYTGMFFWRKRRQKEIRKSERRERERERVCVCMCVSVREREREKERERVCA